MTFTVKICGLTTPEGIDAALASGADMLGFVFHEKSPRHVSFEIARKLAAHVGARGTKVALTVDANDATLAALIAELKPQMLQLHGKETAARVFDIRTRFGLPVMKALSFAAPEDLGQIPAFAKVADWLLFDAKAADGALPGGNGQAFNWRLLAGLKLDKPWLLAGGLTAENVGEAIKAARAGVHVSFGVDVSSGVESSRGVKDAGKIAAFIAKARQAAEKQMA